MFASRSAMESESSAKAGSNALRGNAASLPPAPRAESRKEERDEGRNGVVGRDVRVREADLGSAEPGASADMFRPKLLESRVSIIDG